MTVTEQLQVKTNRGVERIHAAFARAQAENRAAFMPFMTAGYPSAEGFQDVVDDLVAEADLIEIGIPYSDPLGDGPTVQRANERALAGGTSTRRSLELVAQLRTRHDLPIVVMTTRTGDKHQQLALALGADDYFAKPADERRLTRRLGELMVAGPGAAP